MSRKILLLALIVAATAATLATVVRTRAQLTAPTTMTNNYVISGPYNHDNLSVFLVHGQDHLKGKTPITLEEGLKQKKVKVHETKNVNQLAIENTSADEVYVQAGEIVKGGQQDRTLAYDLIIPARSGRIPIDAFCVESGRWHGRAGEATAEFSASTMSLNSKDLKVAAKSSKNQGQVWEKVAETQGKLARNARSGVPGGAGSAPAGVAVSATPVPQLRTASPTSLQLTLEHSEVKKSAELYTKKLRTLIDEKTDAIGYVFAINGEVNSADIYGSRALFVKLWSKLLDASAAEAIAELDASKKSSEPVTIEKVRVALAAAERGTRSTKQVTSRVELVTHESEKELFFETRDRERDGAWIHRNYISK